MKLTKYRIGNYFEPLSQKCNIPNLTESEVSGINIEKEFFEPSRQVGEDTSKYKIVPPNYFACNLMHVGRDVVLPIALNHTNNNKIVSPAYTVFKIKDDSPILRDYFFIMLKSHERDRYFWFNTDSSIRGDMPWDVFCNIELKVPPLSIQKKYVNVYKAMIANQQSYERGLEDLKLVCDAYIEDLRRKMPSEEIGKYITRRDVRNGINGTKNVMGISTTKEFREPTSKVNKNELSNYKVVKPRQIGFVQTTHNEKVFTYAFNNTDEDIVISSVNEVFSCDEDKLLPEYLSMFFNRTEFDRYARFHSWGSARETFTWSDLVEVKIPVPDIKVQQSIANMYTAYKERKYINERLKSQIKNICPILIKGSLEECEE
ncbi:MAG: restriction endonuclease subunit S [Ruminococcus sp.]|uniref:restriction endonuclease subunit S n=1 Tax=Ruminococcus sp. TaxID=41978 RepID=UPI0025D78322|nr:restriction endonuclease subunit S [Ruminococcus sp.]MCR4794900.1 restriction endonuclease subunit S [Ruminococcus sp.]